MLISHIDPVDTCFYWSKLTLDMILVPAGWLETIARKKNKFSIKWSKKPIIIGSPWNIAMHVIHLVPSFFYLYEYDNNIICHKKGCVT